MKCTKAYGDRVISTLLVHLADLAVAPSLQSISYVLFGGNTGVDGLRAERMARAHLRRHHAG